MSTKRYYATYNPNHENKFTTHRCFSGEKEAEGSRDLHWSITGRFTGPVTGTPPVNFLLADLLPTLLAKKITAPLLACQ